MPLCVSMANLSQPKIIWEERLNETELSTLAWLVHMPMGDDMEKTHPTVGSTIL